MSSFENEVEERKTEMLRILESIDVNKIRQDGVTINICGKLFKFNGLEELSEENTEERIRKEYREKLNDQQQRIREKINAKVNQLLVMHQRKSAELKRKEKELEQKYKNSAKMPDITWQHFSQGLSVAKGTSNDELIWSYFGVYNPKTLDFKAIPQRLVNRMKQPIIIVVKTKGRIVNKVETYKRQGVSMNYFPHYHQAKPDCWGKWKHDSTWNTPDDILRIAKNAQAVLENINTGSAADRSPEGLPRMDTLKKHVRENPNARIVRGEEDTDDDDVWSV